MPSNCLLSHTREAATYQPQRSSSKTLAAFKPCAQRPSLLANLRPRRREHPQWARGAKNKQQCGIPQFRQAATAQVNVRKLHVVKRRNKCRSFNEGRFYNCLKSLRKKGECIFYRRECDIPFPHPSNPWAIGHPFLLPKHSQVTHPSLRVKSMCGKHRLWPYTQSGCWEWSSGFRAQSHQTGVLTMESILELLVVFKAS